MAYLRNGNNLIIRVLYSYFAPLPNGEDKHKKLLVVDFSTINPLNLKN